VPVLRVDEADSIGFRIEIFQIILILSCSSVIRIAFSDLAVSGLIGNRVEYLEIDLRKVLPFMDRIVVEAVLLTRCIDLDDEQVSSTVLIIWL